MMPAPVKVKRNTCADSACDEAWAIYRNAPLREADSALIAGVDDTRPYGDVSHVDWKAQRRVRVHLSYLTLSQHHVSVLGLLRFVEGREKKDVQVVQYGGRLYLHNGHHRVVHAAMAGKASVWARVVDVIEPVAPHRWSADPVG